MATWIADSPSESAQAILARNRVWQASRRIPQVALASGGVFRDKYPPLSRSEETVSMCRFRFAALLLATLATLVNVAVGQEQLSPCPTSSARLPVRLVERPAYAAATRAAPATDAALPLAPLAKPPAAADGRFRQSSTGDAVSKVVTSLAVVLGLFLLGVLLLRRGNARRGGMLPGEVVQTLGRAPLSGRQEMHLVRVGNKLLLLSVTPTGAETLTEITEPEEIDRLAGICRQSHPDSITASFREILWQCGQTQRA